MDNNTNWKNATDLERKAGMRKLLQEGQLAYANKMGRMVSDAEWCRHLNVPSASYSHWINEMRLPVGDNVFKLAKVLGPTVFDVVGMPRMMPDDDMLQEIASVWYKLDQDAKQYITEYAEQHADNPEAAANEGSTINAS